VLPADLVTDGVSGETLCVSLHDTEGFGFIAIIVIMVLSTTYVLFELHDVTGAAKMTLSANVKSVDQAKQLKTLLYDEEGYAQKYLISEDRTYFDLLMESSRQFDRIVYTLRTLQTEEAERSIINQVVNTHQWFESDFSKKSDITAIPDTSQVSEKWHGSFEMIHRQLDHLISLNQLTIGNAMSRVEATTSRSTGIALFLTICTLVVAVIIASLIARTITKPIGDLIKGTGRIAKGNFETIEINSKDEIAQLADAFNDMSRQLKKINEFKAEMMQQISHELRNPLQIIRSSHDLLKRQHLGKLNEKQLKLLSSLDIGAARITAFNNPYLDIAKYDAGMMEYQMVRTDFREVIEPIVSEARLIAASKEIYVNFEVKGTLPKVIADPEKIRVVFRNLLSNAIKYSPEGKQIDILVSPNKFGVRAIVRDQGIGIPPEDLPKVFGRFYQAQNAGKAKTKGTGLGLALVKAFTEGHGGRVLAQSTLDSGSSFIVELPAAPRKYLGVDDFQKAEDDYVPE
jgi:signal transduction histidine kinase